MPVQDTDLPGIPGLRWARQQVFGGGDPQTDSDAGGPRRLGSTAKSEEGTSGGLPFDARERRE